MFKTNMLLKQWVESSKLPISVFATLAGYPIRTLQNHLKDENPTQIYFSKLEGIAARIGKDLTGELSELEKQISNTSTDEPDSK